MLYVVVLHGNPPADIVQVQNVLGAYSHGWYRIAANSWVVCSPQHNAAFWHGALGPVIPAGVFIAQINPLDRGGFAPQQFWNWLDEHAL